MRRGDLPAAWAIADAVLAARDPATRDDPALPYHLRWVWDGRPLAGERVVVRCYHGLGDTLQFARFLPQLRALATHVTLEVQPQLCTLLAGLADDIVPFDVTAPIPAAHDIEIMELVHALRTGFGDARYLHVSTAAHGAQAGVCWQSGAWDPQRSVPLDLLRPFLPAGAVSLQRGASGLPDPLDGSMDMARTAALAAGLDRIITVDGMIAHLAGALGRPMDVLLKHDADWRWGEGAFTPWYPSARLHRQARPGDWASALESLAASLSQAAG